jgi:phenylalanyl-tRNA synthetase beta chain
MANITLSRKALEKHFKLDEKTLQAINMFGTPATLTEDTLEIEVFPNRPDLISLQGFVRAMKAYLGKESGLTKYTAKSPTHQVIVEKSIPQEWPYAVACIVRGLIITDERIKEIIDIQEKLGTTVLRKRKKGGLGIYPLEKIQFPIRFTGMDPDKIKFRPLEYPHEITGRQILSSHPTGREYASICAHWKAFPIFIDAKKEILSMPPIINSHELGKVNESTQDVFLEATGTDLATIQQCLTIFATALAEMGGKIEALTCVQANGEKIVAPSLTSQSIKINLENINTLLGLTLKEKDLEKLLGKMGYEYKKGAAITGAWRTDIFHEVDIAEDIAIAYGYDKLIPEMPDISTIAQEAETDKTKAKIAHLLAGLKLFEISSYHLVKEEEIKRAGSEKIAVEDSKTEYKFLRPSLLIPALRILAENKDQEYPQNLFEIGTVFSTRAPKDSETGIAEHEHLLVATSPGNFTECKQILDYLFRMSGKKYTLKEGIKEGLIEGRTGQVIVDGKNVGIIGEMHPESLREQGIKMPVTLFEIDFDVFHKDNEDKKGN